jgi:hypothetical protein
MQVRVAEMLDGRMRTTLALILVVLGGCGPAVPDAYQPAVGDVVFQSLPRSPLVDTIEGCSESRFSHCGIVTRSGSEFVVLEAFEKVGFTPLAKWIDRGRNGAFSVFRWQNGAAQHVPDVIDAARDFLGRPYDIHYSMDDEAIYCSELIFKAFHKVTGENLGVLVTLGDLNWRPFEATIRQIEGGPPPLEREMITPVALSEATHLTEVLAYGW